jgi:hypothetical protein
MISNTKFFQKIINLIAKIHLKSPKINLTNNYLIETNVRKTLKFDWRMILPNIFSIRKHRQIHI